MSVTISTTDGPVTIWDPEVASLSLEFQGIDVQRELEKLAARISSGKGKKGPSQSLMGSVKAWLRMARPAAPAREPVKHHSVETALEECRGRGLVPERFVPAGESEEAQLASLKAMATCGWYRQNPEVHGDSGLERSQRLLWYIEERAVA